MGLMEASELHPSWVMAAATGSNPYELLQQRLLIEMYPPFAPGFTARVGVLVGVLAAVIVVSIAYIIVIAMDLRRKGRELWLWRIVTRPAGRYLVLNQYMGYPVFAILLACIWIPYTLIIHSMFGGDHMSPDALFFLMALVWTPFFAHLSTVTFAVLSAGNLAQAGRHGPNSHPLGPMLANSIYLVLTPVVLVTISAVGIWTGADWRRFAQSWTKTYNALGKAAKEWDGNFDPVANSLLQDHVSDRLHNFYNFARSQYVCTVVFCLSAAILVVINVTGGVYLLSSLRSLKRPTSAGVAHTVRPKHEPVVAPLEPFKTDLPQETEYDVKELTGDNEDAAASPVFESSPRLGRTAAVSFGDDGQSGEPLVSPTTKLKRLELDVMLFFLSVVPACILFMVLSIYATNNLTLVLRTPRLYELWLIGLPFVYASATLLSLVALTVKTLYNLYALDAGRRLPLFSASSERGHVSSVVEANARRREEEKKKDRFSGVKVVVEWEETKSEYVVGDEEVRTRGESSLYRS